jgi:hypothetical protein
MTKLSPDARDLVEAARAGEGSLAGGRSAARARVRAGVLARVGAATAVGSAAALGSSGTAAKTALFGGLLFKCAAAVGIAGAAAWITVEVTSPGPVATAPPAPARALAMASPVVEPPAPGSATKAQPVAIVDGERKPSESPPAPPSSQPATRPPAPPGPSATTPSLEAETALLEKAQADLREGHPERALAALDAHDAELKGGALGEERRAARILALCAAGRSGEAKAEADRFLAASPRSPMAERVRSSCAGGSPSR